MSYLSNIKKTLDAVSFEVSNNNKFKISYINALRRIMLSEIQVYGIDEKSVTFSKNTSMLDNLLLIHRLVMIPIINSDNINYDNLILKLNYKNNSDSIKSIYIDDFEIIDEKTGKKYKNDEIFKFPKILYAKVKSKQIITLHCKLKKSNVISERLQHGYAAAYSPTSTVSYSFKKDDAMVKEKIKELNLSTKKEIDDFNSQDAERCFKKNNKDEPEIYIYNIETCGQFSPELIFSKSIMILMNRLDAVRNAIKKDNETKVSYPDTELVMNARDILLIDENDTIGNLLQEYILDDQSIHFCGYKISHPLKKEVIIRISFKMEQDNNISNCKKVLINVLENILETSKQLLKDWKTFSK